MGRVQVEARQGLQRPQATQAPAAVIARDRLTPEPELSIPRFEGAPLQRLLKRSVRGCFEGAHPQVRHCKSFITYYCHHERALAREGSALPDFSETKCGSPQGLKPNSSRPYGAAEAAPFQSLLSSTASKEIQYTAMPAYPTTM